MAKADRPLQGKFQIDLFAGLPVKDYKVSLAWYEKLLGCPPTFVPNDAEAVWDLDDHRSIFIELKPEYAGHSRILVFVDDLDELMAQIEKRGLKPNVQEKYSNGVRKANYKDPDGNEIGFGGMQSK